MKTYFTKGPWFIKGGLNQKGEGLEYPSIRDINSNRIIRFSPFDSKDNLMANAVLISRAPELFEALRKILSDENNPHIYNSGKYKKLLMEIANIWPIKNVDNFSE